MPLLYLDATGAYSDPANTNYKYLRADGQWAAPDDAWEFYDATGGWSTPELAPPLAKVTDWDPYSWEEINDFGQQYVLPQPDAYGDLLHVTKTVPLSSPVSKSIVFEIVDVCHTDWGSDHAFVWMPKTECLVRTKFQESQDRQNSYRDSLIRAALLPGGSLANSFPSDLTTVWKDIQYKYLTSATGSDYSAYGNPSVDISKLTIPSYVEVGGPRNPATYGTEGTILQAFAAGDKSGRIRDIDGAHANWWLRSIYRRETIDRYYFDVEFDGGISYRRGTEPNWCVCPCFAV